MIKAVILSILFLWVATSAPAQESHVQVRYEKSIDRTVVHSDAIYAVNMPSQFMQIQLVGRYPGKGKPTQLPDRIYFEFYSFAPNALYQLDAKHRLLVKAGDKVFDFGLLSYSKVEGKDVKEKEKDNPKGPKSNLAFNVSLPPAAVIATAQKKNELTVEFLSIEELSLAHLRLIAGAGDLAMKIGDTVFRFRPVHHEILREFAQAITPENVESLAETKPAREALPPDVPSGERQTQFSDTLRWLKTHIERHGATNDVLTPKRFEPLAFDGCQVGYRTVPLIRTSQVSSSLVHAIMEYRFDLADLNPEATRVADLGDYAAVSMTTRDYQPKIKLFKHANDSGTMGRTLEDSLTESASINFNNKAAALQFKTALDHAINLCQAQR